MFVRWQLYRSQARDRNHREHNDKHARLKAILVESVRIDGKPRQRHVAFLGSTSIDGSDRRRFWYHVTTKLNRLSNRLSPEDRKRIAAAIAQKVEGQLLTKVQVKQFERARHQLMKLTTIMFALLLPTLALAEPQPQPRPPAPGGSCGHGWLSSGSFCVPAQGAQDAVPKQPGGSCAFGWTASGSFCLRSGR
jgi:hypothetical protein